MKPLMMVPRCHESEAKMKIGFVGLGAMGRGMARNLVRAGFPTAVFDVRPDVVRELESDGARAAADAAEVAVGAELVCIAVFDDRQVRQVLAGDGSGPGVLSAASPGTIVALHTTTAPDFVVEMAELATHRHVAVLDLAMTGGSDGTRRGTDGLTSRSRVRRTSDSARRAGRWRRFL
jgi:3-hydroxyisobutyrate dehydrogenase-like beta-hydroxyacid dehydrogenase